MGAFLLDTSKSFEEFVMKKCEEIICNDQECMKLSHEITKKIKELKKTLTNEQMKLFLEYESLDSEFDERIRYILYTFFKNLGQIRVKV